MSFELIYNYPSWYILLCLILAGIYSFVLYYRTNNEASKWLLYLLAGIRFVAVAFLLFLLLNPLLKYKHSVTEKPTIVIGIDNSKSLNTVKDSAFYASDFLDEFIKAKEALSQKFNVVNYSLGAQPKLNGKIDYSELQTDLSSFIKLQKEAFEGQNLAGVVIASDGIYNKGVNPSYSIQNQKSPIHTIVLGDTSIRKDAAIQNIRSNQIAYINNSFPLLVDISAKKCSGESLQLSVWKNGTQLKSETITINGNSFSKTISFQLDAKSLGVQEYRVLLSKANGEKYISNNQRSFYIDVLNNKQKILLCASAPHPDLGAIRRSIEQNQNYEFKLKIDELPVDKDLDEYSLIILHQYPSARTHESQIKRILDKKVPVLFVFGTATQISTYSKLNLPVKINGIKNSVNESQAKINNDFLLFELSEEYKNRFTDLPPLVTPFGKYRVPLENNILFSQKIGVVETNYPLIYLDNSEGYRTGYILGEGWWRWAMTEFEKEGNFDGTNELLGKIIQYLSIKKDQRKLRVNPSKKSYSENESIVFDAELYNESYELTNVPEINLEISDAEGKNYSFVFSKIGNKYRSPIGRLPSGQYQFTSTANMNGKKHNSSGYFVVKKLEAELMNLEANHLLLQKLSRSTNGKSYNQKSWSKLTEDLLNDESLVPIKYTNNSFRELLHQKWIFYLLIFLFSLEWFLRKWNSI